MRCQSSRGQVAPLVAVVLLVALGTALVSTQLARGAVLRSQAQAAADATALAVAVDGVSSAEPYALANRSVLGSVDEHGSFATVTVAVSGVEALARAEAYRPEWYGLQPALVLAIRRAERLLGRSIPIVSGHRSRAEQRTLWEQRHRHPYAVARPGASLHERGLAIDVPATLVPELARVGPTVGLCHPLPSSDPVHFVLC